MAAAARPAHTAKRKIINPVRKSHQPQRVPRPARTAATAETKAMPNPAPAAIAPSVFFRGAVSGAVMLPPIGHATTYRRGPSLYSACRTSEVGNARHCLVARGVGSPYLRRGAVGA